MLLFFTADPSAGRVDIESLSDQTMMEILFADLTEKSKAPFLTEDGGYKDISEWRGVTLGPDGRVHDLYFDSAIAGSVTFNFLPLHTAKAYFRACHIRATIDTSRLPMALENLSVIDIPIDGTIDMRQWPHEITNITLFTTFVGGTCDLTALPLHLIQLQFAQSDLHGNIDLSSLPCPLEYFDLQDNKLEGNVNFDTLPPALEVLHLATNRLSGSIHLENLPPSLELIDLSSNAFSGEPKVLSVLENCDVYLGMNQLSGTAVVQRSEGLSVNIRGNAITDVVDEKGEAYTSIRNAQGHVYRFF